MNYLIFPAQTDAQSASDQIAQNMGLPVIGIDGATGTPDPTAQQTVAWDIPRQILGANGNPGDETYQPAHPLFSAYPNEWCVTAPDAPYMTNVTNYIAARA